VKDGQRKTPGHAPALVCQYGVEPAIGNVTAALRKWRERGDLYFPAVLLYDGWEKLGKALFLHKKQEKRRHGVVPRLRRFASVYANASRFAS
jgi:hypothetical protein